jgi:hypothetical protein
VYSSLHVIDVYHTILPSDTRSMPVSEPCAVVLVSALCVDVPGHGNGLALGHVKASHRASGGALDPESQLALRCPHAHATIRMAAHHRQVHVAAAVECRIMKGWLVLGQSLAGQEDRLRYLAR